MAKNAILTDRAQNGPDFHHSVCSLCLKTVVEGIQLRLG